MAIIAFDLVNGTSQNLTSFSVNPNNSASGGAFPGSIFDVFGVTDRNVNFDFADDSAGSFPADAFGVVGTGDTDPFFGVEDLDNGDNPGGTGMATWTFDVLGAEDLSFSVDLAAMGDFEAGDNGHTFSYRIDGGVVRNLFTIDADNDGSFVYTLESGTTVSLNDPLVVTTTATGATQIVTNDFTTFTTDIIGTGSQLELFYEAGANNGGSEVFAFRDIVIESGVNSFSILQDQSVQDEGDTGTTDFTFTVIRSGDTSGATTVDFAVSGDADANDFGGALPMDTVTFLAGESSRLITLAVSGDTDAELDEVFTVTLSNPGNGEAITTATADGTILNDDGVAITPIYAIQGKGHQSSFAGQTVTTTGIVTAVAFNGYYLQDATGDGDDETSDGVFVSTGSSPSVAVGDEVEVTGSVSEVIPGGAATGNLSLTQISSSSETITSSGNALPTSVLLGAAGRSQSNSVTISGSELPVNLQTDPGVYNPSVDAIDFFESLEGMLVTVDDPVAISQTRTFTSFSSEGWVLADLGTNATGGGLSGGLNGRGGLIINADPDGYGDTNPERIQLQYDGTIFPGGSNVPRVTIGDEFGDVTGVVGYSFGNFEINVTDAFAVTQPSSLTQEVTTLGQDDGQLTIATYNVLNLTSTVANEGGGLDPDADQRAALAAQIVNNLGAPDIIALQEIQDNSGQVNDGTTDASQTLQDLVDAVALAGGPTYAFFDVAPIDGTQGGVPGGNIRNAFLYDPTEVKLNSFAALTQAELTAAGVTDPTAFDGTRIPLLATFDFDGDEVTVINNHLSSRFGSTPIFGGPQPFVQAGEAERAAQTQALNDYVDFLLNGNPDANIAVVGDFNTFEFTEELDDILPGVGTEEVLTNLITTLTDDDGYSFVFDGNSQALDHIFVTEGLAEFAEVDYVHVNTDFSFTDSSGNALRPSDHEPVLVTLEFPSEPEVFTLQLFHAADQEGGLDAIQDAPRFSGVLNALREQDLDGDGVAGFANTLTLSSGDAFIPGLFANASEEVFGGAARADILIQNELGFEAISFGNHEFDFGTRTLAELIAGDPDDGFVGALFPYLSTNLDFSTDSNFAAFGADPDAVPPVPGVNLIVPDGGAPLPNSVTGSVVFDVNGERIGVIGATTPELASLSSQGDVGIRPADFDDPLSAEDLQALADEIQIGVDALLSDGINKVILLSHMQDLNIERGIAPLLNGVDIIVGGGSNTRLFDENDRIRPGDTQQGDYPEFYVNEVSGDPVALVNTDGSYKYVGRLVLDFDENGVIIPESYDAEVSGAYATDEQGLIDVGGAGLVDPEIQDIVDQIEDQILETESVFFGVTTEFLNGERSGGPTDGVRTQETNLGNLTADANLFIARQTDPTVQVSLKNGGGIRANIGDIVVPPGGGAGDEERLAPEAIPGVRPEGGISQNAISNTLAFNNDLTLLTLTATELLAILEHGVAAYAGQDAPQGRFPQISGVEFSFDPDAPANDRIVSAAIVDDAGMAVEALVQDGEIVGDPAREIRIVTLGFLADGGDSYPFPTGPAVNRVDLVQDGVQTGQATFADDGTEQDSLAEYLAAVFPDADNAFSEKDVSPAFDERIQNLDFRDDTVLDDLPVDEPDFESVAVIYNNDAFLPTLDAYFEGDLEEQVVQRPGREVRDGSLPFSIEALNTGEADSGFAASGDEARRADGDLTRVLLNQGIAIRGEDERFFSKEGRRIDDDETLVVEIDEESGLDYALSGFVVIDQVDGQDFVPAIAEVFRDGESVGIFEAFGKYIGLHPETGGGFDRVEIRAQDSDDHFTFEGLVLYDVFAQDPLLA